MVTAPGVAEESLEIAVLVADKAESPIANKPSILPTVVAIPTLVAKVDTVTPSPAVGVNLTWIS